MLSRVLIAYLLYLPLFRRSDGVSFVFGTIYRPTHRKAIVGHFLEVLVLCSFAAYIATGVVKCKKLETFFQILFGG